MPPVLSSMMTFVDYDAATRELLITFVGGDCYCYRGVPEGVYAALLGASSKGAFFNRHIRDQFSFNEVARVR